MKILVLILALASLTVSAEAIQRYNIGSMSCSQVHAVLQQERAAILRHRSPRSGLVLYDRYVENGNYCPSYNVAVTDYLPTADNPSCPVYHCVRGDNLPGGIDN